MQDTRITLSVSVDDEGELLDVVDRLTKVMSSFAIEGHQVSLGAGPDAWADEGYGFGELLDEEEVGEDG